jgi:hypothetical protein
MEFPKGMKNIPGHALLLVHSLNGTKQGAHDWHARAHDALTSLGFTNCAVEPCIYFNWRAGRLRIVALYVDDFRIICDAMEDLQDIEKSLKLEFKMKSNANNLWLGLKLDKSDDGIYVSCKTKIEQLLQQFGMSDCKPCATPVAPGTKLPKIKAPDNKFPYREAVGILLWLARTARPDIIYAVAELSKHCNDHGPEHEEAVKRTLRYLKGTINLGAMYRKAQELTLELYTDANFGGEGPHAEYPMRSTTGTVLMAKGVGPIACA